MPYILKKKQFSCGKLYCNNNGFLRNTRLKLLISTPRIPQREWKVILMRQILTSSLFEIRIADISGILFLETLIREGTSDILFYTLKQHIRNEKKTSTS